jgi:hypothetical protein
LPIRTPSPRRRLPRPPSLRLERTSRLQEYRSQEYELQQQLYRELSISEN